MDGMGWRWGSIRVSFCFTLLCFRAIILYFISGAHSERPVMDSTGVLSAASTASTQSATASLQPPYVVYNNNHPQHFPAQNTSLPEHSCRLLLTHLLPPISSSRTKLARLGSTPGTLKVAARGRVGGLWWRIASVEAARERGIWLVETGCWRRRGRSAWVLWGGGGIGRDDEMR